MIEMFGRASQVLRWREPGELAKIVDEMRLIIIAAIERDIDPVNLALSMYGFQNALEPAHAAESFRREADLFVE